MRAPGTQGIGFQNLGFHGVLVQKMLPNRSFFLKNDLGAQGPPKSAQEPPKTPQEPPKRGSKIT